MDFLFGDVHVASAKKKRQIRSRQDNGAAGCRRATPSSGPTGLRVLLGLNSNQHLTGQATAGAAFCCHIICEGIPTITRLQMNMYRNRSRMPAAEIGILTT
ncbi:hypothetical protein KL948_002236 [Ogataea haglerorum]|uniref:Uncharacterized protein n=1 Tax=Ogataea haglerorum TaxID=1937702 RepID=A0ABQ7RIS0_9ASCO|nr:hypothetical protein KL948_002236 [Ogataea haglerorum]KAG7766463.1 hypothetical protein KL946_001651 [Ogataea haglerorum]